uniref:Uncharacterized protein n=1 Tax=Rhizophora mucronata TaxID=61149 RepID=A0A2P2LJL7_RHIMU
MCNITALFLILIFIELHLQAPISVPVSSEKFCLLTKGRTFELPCPFDNSGNYVIR